MHAYYSIWRQGHEKLESTRGWFCPCWGRRLPIATDLAQTNQPSLPDMRDEPGALVAASGDGPAEMSGGRHDPGLLPRMRT